MRWSGLLVSLCLLVALSIESAQATSSPAPDASIVLGHSTVPLNEPWRFRVGDDDRWASPDFDDGEWETVDLTPAPGAHDGDVGLPGYVTGWSQRGHAGYTGYAWYRTRVTVHSDGGRALALAGPTLVDSTYQLYVNGKMLGGPGGFSRSPPTVFAVRPSVFPLPSSPSTDTQTYVIAFRVWLDPLEAGGESGGMHIAPVMGDAEAIQQLHQLQWLQTFKGYVVDAAEPLAFVLLAIMVLALMAGRTGDGYRWLVVALLCLALLRAQQVLFFWTPYVSLRGYDIAVTVILKPLTLAAWLLAWRDWFRLNRHPWLGYVISVLTLAYIAFACIGRPWFAPDGTQGFKAVAHVVVMGLRLALAALYLWIVGLGVARSAKLSTWLAALAAIFVGVGLFATEFNALGIPGIWFPFGTGVSRSQYAYGVFTALLFALILMRSAGDVRSKVSSTASA
ncbi:glycoside hydrolase family 2 [Dyella kyungheensis]|uniref:glycoside hydrolase family 2 n=1 Tax=Dyella kyungheensis TaxID=1242174 RepID=UPI003CE77879